MTKVGRNVQYEVKENILTIKIDLKDEGKSSKSGKSQVTATTAGNIAVGDKQEHFLSMNVFRYLNAK